MVAPTSSTRPKNAASAGSGRPVAAATVRHSTAQCRAAAARITGSAAAAACNCHWKAKGLPAPTIRRQARSPARSAATPSASPAAAVNARAASAVASSAAARNTARLESNSRNR
ncbi:hypothetical protein KCH_59120 [Kitasatospora cheerisanensis KCTC 2395]|uniref:Uncharacterized protein n=1 Tax=Kitasatospora cheerisanensis KCTC 2395 TaxID=1348663 RepID=A0A066YWU1_9ACTN|nr:hypothetical protein KCH_59120 [Kitasatospora cheerisanensis KCTC 2395]